MYSTRARKSRDKTKTVNLSKDQIEIELQKKYFEEDNNFMDYFLEVGVKPEIFKNKHLYEQRTLEQTKLLLNK